MQCRCPCKRQGEGDLRHKRCGRRQVKMEAEAGVVQLPAGSKGSLEPPAAPRGRKAPVLSFQREQPHQHLEF